MFLKSLKIENDTGVIRQIDFHKGLNLIVDNTPFRDEKTGNNVGKTTVLRLIDYCLGGSAKDIYTDKENKNINEEAKKFLESTRVVVSLTCISKFDGDNKEVTIRRNFLLRKDLICQINGENVSNDNFEQVLGQKLLGKSFTKPSFRQVISHNIRIDDSRIENALKTLNPYTKNIEYETLHLFLFGCNFDDGERRQEIARKLETECNYKRRLEKNANKSMLSSKLALIENDIQKLKEQKESFNLNPNFEADLAALNEVQFRLTQYGTELSQKLLRKSLIQEAIDDLQKSKSSIDEKLLASIYDQAKKLVPAIQKTFSELLNFHNQMADKKAAFIASEMPKIDEDIDRIKKDIASSNKEAQRLSELVKKSGSYESINELVTEINDKYREKGALEQSIKQIEESESIIAEEQSLLDEIDNNLFSTDQKALIQKQIDKFNRYFSSTSNELYREQYAIGFEINKDRDGKQYYKFVPFSTNFSTGKKHGEVTCFELAYIQFADSESIPCLHFILNDKKELVHGNQLEKIGKLVNEWDNIQYVASILKDKLPSELNSKQNIILELSQEEKLFKF